MNFEKKPTVRRAALGASLAIAAAGVLVAPPASAAGETLVVVGTPQAGSAFTVNAGALAPGSYKVILTMSDLGTDKTNVAEAGSCTTAQTVAAPTTTLSCTLTENTAAAYYAKLLDGSDAILKSVAVAVKGTTPALTAPIATDAAATATDKVTLTRLDGVVWTVNGTAVDFAGAATKEVLVGATGLAAVKATPAAGYSLPAGAQDTWNFKFSTGASPLTTVVAPTPTASDQPGTAQDTVTVTKTAGITWTVNGAPVTFSGTNTTASVYVTTGKDATVVATSDAGYAFAGNLAAQSFTVKLTDVKAEPASTRLSGASRMDTAVEVSKKYWTTATTVYVANGWRYADALAAGPAAAKDDAPLLLVQEDGVPTSVLDEIKRLKPARIHIVGGTSVVSSGVEATLNAVAPVTRLAGGTRYATAAAVAGKWADGSAPVVYLALGENFPDALSGGSGAAGEDGALLLSTKTTMTQPTMDALKRLKPKKVVLVGGTDVLADAVRLEVKDAVGVDAARYAGADRYATSAAVALGAGTAVPADKVMFLATGLNFPDALAGVPAADKIGAPLFLSQPSCMPASVKSVVDKNLTGLTSTVRLGSEGVLGNFPLTAVCA